MIRYAIRSIGGLPVEAGLRRQIVLGVGVGVAVPGRCEEVEQVPQFGHRVAAGAQPVLGRRPG
ncbi:hypothetical protein [Kitasatospora sp. NPDC057223]|uniref:hypothetical protein n=1 Tax=Kitasatospora sp. NPDC057223 TaxID=3346055 RepID=UPI00363FA21D